jgi:phospholipid transport system substrate-binding protein
MGRCDMKKSSFYLFICLLGSSLSLLANFEGRSKQDPVQAIQASIVKFNQLSLATQQSPQIRNHFIQNSIIPLFDFKHIANQILLVVNQRLTIEQRQIFEQKIKENLINTLLSKLAGGSPGAFQFISARPTLGNSLVVSLKMNGYFNFGIYIDLLLHQNQQGYWQIFDLVLNNDSLINYYQKRLLIKTRRHGLKETVGKF